jgi:hypothetical protein
MLHGFLLEKYQQKAVKIKLIPAINGSLLTFIPTIDLMFVSKIWIKCSSGYHKNEVQI